MSSQIIPVKVSEKDSTEDSEVASLKEENPLSEKLESKSLHFAEYHKAFFDFGYFLLIIPFRLVCEEEDDEREIRFHRNRLQEVLCAIVQTLVMYEYVSSIRLHLVEKIDRSPMSYLHVVTSIASFFYVLFFIYVFWAKRKLFKRLLDEVQHVPFASPAGKCAIFKIRTLAILFFGFSSLVALTDPTIHDGFLIRFTIYDTFKKFSCRARSYYLYEHCPDVQPNLLPPNESVMEMLVTGLHLLIYIPNLIIVHIVDVVVVLSALCVWHVLKDFIVHSKQPGTSVEEALTNYETLKRLVKLMNSAVGLLTFSTIAVSLPFYASWGTIAFNENKTDCLYLIHFVHFTINFFVILTVGADFNYKMGTFYDYMLVPEICEQISSNRLSYLLKDMYTNQIAIKGCGFFVMSYKFCGTVLSLILTYTIIILQFQFSRWNFSQVNCTCMENLNYTNHNHHLD